MNMQNEEELHLQANYRLLVELENSNQAFNTLVDLLGEVVFSCRQDGGLTFVNAAWKKILGQTPNDVLGHKLYDFAISTSDRDELKVSFVHEREISREIMLSTQSGGEALVIMRARRKGNNWYGSLYDLSTQKRILQQRAESQNQVRKLSLVAQLTDNMVIITDADGAFEWVNEGFTRATGYELPEILGKRPGQVLQGPLTDQKIIQHMRRCVTNCESFNVEVLNYTKSGNPFWAAIDCSPVFSDDDKLINFIAIERDITTQKKQEEVLREAKKNAEELSAARTRFIANMSHEIRTPLNSILGMSSVLAATELDDEQRTCIETISNGGKALLALVDDVLDFAKVESGGMEFEVLPFATCSIFEQAVDIVASSAKEKSLDVYLACQSPIPMEMVGDQHRIRQVLLNLLSNAIKFTQHGSVKILVNWEWLDSSSGTLSITVADTGIGIHKDKQSELFHEFTQEDPSVTRKYGGSGLGLAICHQICDRLGGGISVSSETGKGSTFVAEIPVLAKPDEPPLAPSSKQVIVDSQGNTDLTLVLQVVAKQCGLAYQKGHAHDGKITYFDGIKENPVQLSRLEGIYSPHRLMRLMGLGAVISNNQHEELDVNQHNPLERLRVLVAEDVVPNQMVMRSMLTKLGVQRVTIVNNGAEAVSAISTEVFDVVFLDVHMPVMDGFTAAESLSKSQKDAIKLIALSADVSVEARQRAAEAGIEAWLSKPVVLSELEQALRD